MPTHVGAMATADSASRAAANVAAQISSGSCSTQPSEGKAARTRDSREHDGGIVVDDEHRDAGGSGINREDRHVRHPTVGGGHARADEEWASRSADGEESMRVGVLTGGGDAPGLNCVIRAVVRKGVAEFGKEFVGFRDGWKGPLTSDTMPLNIAAVRGILPRGGTILGSSPHQPPQAGGRGRHDREQPRHARGRRADRDRRRRHARCRRQAVRRGGQRRRRPEDDRQRPRGH